MGAVQMARNVTAALAGALWLVLGPPLRLAVLLLARLVWRDLLGHEVRQPSKASKWSPERLEPLRQVGDPLADRCYAVLQADVVAGRLAASYNMLDEIARRAGEERRQGLAEEERLFSRLEEHVNEVPSWVDWEVVDRAKDWFTQVGVPAGAFILTTASLVQSYGAANGSTVLVETGRLKGDIMSRVYETGYFVHQVMTRGSLRPGLSGHVAIVQVRMLHCAIREHLMNRKKGWNTAKLGVPVNQEDLAGTLSIFCTVVVEGLAKMGYEVSEEEIAEFHHLWRFIGHVLGVQEDVLTKTYQEQVDQSYAIRDHQWAPAPHGKALVSSLFTQLHLRPDYFFLPTAFWTQLSRQLLGDKNAKDLGFLDEDPFWEAVIQLFCAMVRLQSFVHHKFPFTTAMTVFVSHHFWSVFIFLGLQGRSVSFKTKKYAQFAKARTGAHPSVENLAGGLSCPFAAAPVS